MLEQLLRPVISEFKLARPMTQSLQTSWLPSCSARQPSRAPAWVGHLRSKPLIERGFTTLGGLVGGILASGGNVVLLPPLEDLEDLRLRLFCCCGCCRSLEERRRRTPAAFTVENEVAAMHAATIAKSARNFLLEIPDIILVVVGLFFVVVVVVVVVVIASSSSSSVLVRLDSDMKLWKHRFEMLPKKNFFAIAKVPYHGTSLTRKIPIVLRN